MRRDELSAVCRPSGTPQCRCEAEAWQRERARLASEENQFSARVTLFPPTEGSWHPTSSPLLSTLPWTPSPPCPLCKGKGRCSSHGVYANSHGVHKTWNLLVSRKLFLPTQSAWLVPGIQQDTTLTATTQIRVFVRFQTLLFHVTRHTCDFTLKYIRKCFRNTHWCVCLYCGPSGSLFGDFDS